MFVWEGKLCEVNKFYCSYVCMEQGTATNLHLVGEARSPPRKVRLTRIGAYSRTCARAKVSFLEAHRKAQETESNLISVRTGVRLIHSLSNLSVYGERKEVQEPKGLLLPTPGLEMFLEGESKRIFSTLQDFAFWSGGLLISSGGKKLGSQVVAGPAPWCKGRSVFHVPRELENARGIALLYEPGTWSFYADENDILYLPKENARPIQIPGSSKNFNLSLLDSGTDLSIEETPQEITIFVLSRCMEFIGPVLCALAPNGGKRIRISALLEPTHPMGAILETPWE